MNESILFHGWGSAFNKKHPSEQHLLLKQRDQIIKLFNDNAKDKSSLEIVKALNLKKKSQISTILNLMEDNNEISIFNKSINGNVRWVITTFNYTCIKNNNDITNIVSNDVNKEVEDLIRLHLEQGIICERIG
jgi:hypothetical protein